MKGIKGSHVEGGREERGGKKRGLKVRDDGVTAMGRVH